MSPIAKLPKFLTFSYRVNLMNTQFAVFCMRTSLAHLNSKISKIDICEMSTTFLQKQVATAQKWEETYEKLKCLTSKNDAVDQEISKLSKRNDSQECEISTQITKINQLVKEYATKRETINIFNNLKKKEEELDAGCEELKKGLESLKNWEQELRTSNQQKQVNISHVNFP